MSKDYGPDPMEVRKDVTSVTTANVVDQSGDVIHTLFDESEKKHAVQGPPKGGSVDPTAMIMAVGVQFKSAGKIYEFDSQGKELAARTVVVVETEHGEVMGEVIRAPRPVVRVALPPKVYTVLRVATQEDFMQRERNRRTEDEIAHYAFYRSVELEIPLKVVQVEVFHTGKKALVYFSADDRVDFRDIIKDLVHRFRLRLELRHLGPRDAAKMIGGIGDCGRELCCSSWLREFAPVSIRMAKDQGLALNPGKLSGQCGKLKCCLSYEDATYKELGKGMPKVGKKVSCASGCGTVVSRNILKQELSVILEDGTRVSLKAGEYERMQPPGQKQAPQEDADDDHDDSISGDLEKL